MNIPPKLYKYESFNTTSLENLKNQGLYFAGPKNFNDPFDCSIDANLIFKYKNKLKKLHSQFLNESSNKEEFIRVYGKNPNEEFKKSLVKPLKTTFSDIKENMINNKGISCFSKTNKNILMWSHYSDCHKGFCLEFDTNFDPFNKARRVKYDTKYPTFDISSVVLRDNPDQILDVFLTKHLSWKYEEEWRIFHNQVNTFYGYPKESLTGIYFGAEMPYAHIEIIALIILGQNPDVNLYKSTKNPSSFSVDFEKVNYTPYVNIPEESKA
jgi:hypothetical protein